ncbi:MAG: MCP four helix bundle domain-containing protein, partial [Chloroflexi bacterium]|nr:MCP four helix bundle domain-containing protein [Chloroflexota bacterium]
MPPSASRAIGERHDERALVGREAALHRLHDLRLRVKLLGAFAIVLALLVVVDVVAVSRLALLDGLLREMYHQHSEGLALVMQASVDRVASGRAERDAVLADNPAEAARHADTSRKALAAVAEGLDKFKALTSDEEMRRAVAQAERDVAELQAAREQVLQLAIAGEDDAARALSAQNRPLGTRVDQVLEALQTAKLEAARQAANDGNAAYESARTVMIVVSVLAFLVALVLGWVLAQTLSERVGRITVAAKGLAAGDIEQRVDDTHRDEIGQMAAAFRDMITYQREMASAATAVAQGDLTVQLTPKSERDVLGQAFQRMLADLNGLVNRVRRAAEALAGAADQLGQA